MMTPAEREKFHAIRRTIVGGSDAGPVCGLDPKDTFGRTDMTTYLEKIEAVEPQEETEAMRWGQIMEPVVIQEFCDRFSCNVKVGLDLARLDGHPHIGYHTDGLLIGDDGKPTAIVEAKTSSAWSKLPWGEHGTDEIPRTYMLQVQQGMLVYGLDRAFMPTLIGGNDFRVYEIERDQKLIDNMILVEDKFWQRVLDKNPPEIDGTEDSRRFLEALHPKDDGSTIQADSYLNEWLGRLKVSRDDQAEAKKRELEARNKIIEKMGDARILEGVGCRVTYGRSKDRYKTAWSAIAQALNAPDKLIKKHTEIVMGSRAFRPTWKG